MSTPSSGPSQSLREHSGSGKSHPEALTGLELLYQTTRLVIFRNLREASLHSSYIRGHPLLPKGTVGFSGRNPFEMAQRFHKAHLRDTLTGKNGRFGDADNIQGQPQP